MESHNIAAAPLAYKGSMWLCLQLVWNPNRTHACPDWSILGVTIRDVSGKFAAASLMSWMSCRPIYTKKHLQFDYKCFILSVFYQ